LLNPADLLEVRPPQRKKHRQEDPEPDVRAFQRRPGPAAAARPSRRISKTSAAPRARRDRVLEHLLERTGLSRWQAEFAEEQITVDLLAEWTAAEMVAMMPRGVPKGPASTLLRLAREHVKEQAASGGATCAEAGSPKCVGRTEGLKG